MRLQISENLALIQAEITAQYTRLNGDKSALMDGMGELLEGSTRERFHTEKAPDGASWQDLSDLTIELKGHAGKLKDSGNLADSITHNYTATTAEVGAPLIYAATHQEGATITTKGDTPLIFGNQKKTVFAKSVTIPARPFLGISDEDAGDMIDLIHNFVKGD